MLGYKGDMRNYHLSKNCSLNERTRCHASRCLGKRDVTSQDAVANKIKPGPWPKHFNPSPEDKDNVRCFECGKKPNGRKTTTKCGVLFGATSRKI